MLNGDVSGPSTVVCIAVVRPVVVNAVPAKLVPCGFAVKILRDADVFLSFDAASYTVEPSVPSSLRFSASTLPVQSFALYDTR